MGLCTEMVTNYSDAPGRYDGPEGTSPGGKPTCVGTDRESGMRKRGHHYVDIWGLALVGSGRVGRLTHFNDYPALKAPNPAVSASGWYMAVQTARVGGAAGGRPWHLPLRLRQGAESAALAGGEAAPQARRGQAAWRCLLARAQRRGSVEASSDAAICRELLLTKNGR